MAGSSELLKVLQILQLVVYIGLFLVALINWRRRPGQASAWLVATFGVLAAVVVAGQFLPEDSANPAAHWATKALLATLVLFPYFLYRFTTSLIRPIAWVNVVGTALTASLVIAAFVLPAFPPEAPRRPSGSMSTSRCSWSSGCSSQRSSRCDCGARARPSRPSRVAGCGH